VSGIADGSRTEKATPRKKKEQRKKGNVFLSRDLSGALGFLAILSAMRLLSPYFFSYLRKMVPDYFGKAASVGTLTAAGAAGFISGLVLRILLLSLPVLMIAALAGFLLGGAQTRFLFAPSLLKFKFSRIDPVAGIKRLFAVRSFVELLKSLLKVVIIASVLYTEIKARFSEAALLPGKDVLEALVWIADAVYSILLKICIVMICLGVLDFLYQWWDYERQLRMTKQEVKDEYKNTEGDPTVKGRIRQIQNRIRHARMMQKVPKADVVVRNPTHYAVAIRYDALHNRAPTVVAKGKDLIALKIVEVAEQNHVAVMENRPLARGLYEAVDLDREIPEKYYQAVAEVLAFVYNLKRSKQGV